MCATDSRLQVGSPACTDLDGLETLCICVGDPQMPRCCNTTQDVCFLLLLVSVQVKAGRTLQVLPSPPLYNSAAALCSCFGAGGW